MKTYLLMTLAAGALLLSCQKNTPSSDLENPQWDGPTGTISVKVQLPELETKAVFSSIQDVKINSVQVLVFNNESSSADYKKLETSRYQTSFDGSLDITTRTGAKTVYAIVNAPRLNFSSLDKLETETNFTTAKGTLSDLGDNRTDNLVMSGKNNITVTEYDKNKVPDAVAQSLVVRVKRLSAMVQLEQITVNFDGTMLEGGELAILDVCLANVVGKSPYGVQSIGIDADIPGSGIPYPLPTSEMQASANWYSLAQYVAGAPAVTCDRNLGEAYKCSGATVKGSAKEMNLAFLAYPNPSANYQSSAAATTQVHTSLVIKGHIKSNGTTLVDTAIDKDTYYTFDLPALEANKKYKISNINITMPGANNPGERVTTGKLTGSVVIDEWGTTTDLTYDF